MLKNKVEELVDKYLDEVISIRRHIHQNPELSQMEKPEEIQIPGYVLQEHEND